MIVFINNHKVEIFLGAVVKDAVRCYSTHSSKRVESGALLIVDRYGNKTVADGELTEGQKLYLKKCDHG
ncbi:MAG: hypothetical protein NTU98_11330 [Bacteroidetes bacterium]|nr:hypothetical protein [Bacteroidota bacterium]